MPAAPIPDTVVLVDFTGPAPEVTVELDPMSTVLTSLVEGFGPLSHRLSPTLRRSMAEAARDVPIPALIELTTGGTAATNCPDFVGLAPTGDTFAEQLEQVRATPAADIEADLSSPDVTPTLGRSYHRDPDRFVARYCTALDRYWRDVVQPHYPRAEERLRREVERLRVGIEIHGFRTMAGLLHPRLLLDRDQLLVASKMRAGKTPWAAHRLLVRPMISAPATVYSNVGTGGTSALRGMTFCASPPALHPGWYAEDEWHRGLGRLGLLIGRSRAHIMHSLLRRPGTTTDLADEFGLTPATVSHHLKALQAAGVVVRVRRGSAVYYLLHDRGRRLTAL